MYVKKWILAQNETLTQAEKTCLFQIRAINFLLKIRKTQAGLKDVGYPTNVNGRGI